MFRLHALSVDILSKIKQVMNEVISEQERIGRQSTKNTSFDI